MRLCYTISYMLSFVLSYMIRYVISYVIVSMLVHRVTPNSLLLSDRGCFATFVLNDPIFFCMKI